MKEMTVSLSFQCNLAAKTKKKNRSFLCRPAIVGCPSFLVPGSWSDQPRAVYTDHTTVVVVVAAVLVQAAALGLSIPHRKKALATAHNHGLEKAAR